MVLSQVKQAAHDKAMAEAKGENKGKKKKDSSEPPQRVKDIEGFNRLKEHAEAAKRKVQKKSMMR